MKNKYWIFLIIFLLLISIITTAETISGLADQIIKMTSGVPGKKSAVLTYELLNPNEDYFMDIFLVCEIKRDFTQATSSFLIDVDASKESKYVTSIITINPKQYIPLIVNLDSDTLLPKSSIPCMLYYILYEKTATGKLYLTQDVRRVTESELKESDYHTRGLTLPNDAILFEEKASEQYFIAPTDCGDGMCTELLEDENNCPKDCGGRRGKPLLLYVILGGIALFIFIIFFLLFRTFFLSKKVKELSKSSQESNYEFCPRCRTKNLKGAQFCSGCRTRLR